MKNMFNCEIGQEFLFIYLLFIYFNVVDQLGKGDIIIIVKILKNNKIKIT